MSKILLVDDEDRLREIYEVRFKAEGYDVVTARDGEEALAVVVREKPDLVIVDIMMPKISGFDVIDILRTTEDTQYVKIIAMSALGQREDIERGKKLGADMYLVKSQATMEDVVASVAELLS